MINKIKQFFQSKKLSVDCNCNKLNGEKWCSKKIKDCIADEIRNHNEWGTCSYDLCNSHFLHVEKFKEFLEKRYGTFIYKAYILFSLCNLHFYVLSKMTNSDRDYLIASITVENKISPVGLRMLDYQFPSAENPHWLPPNTQVLWEN